MAGDLLGELLAWAQGLRFEHLPAPVRDDSARSLANTIAAMLGGSGAPGAVETARVARSWGGAQSATVAGHGFRAPAPFAALANGVSAHALDYDDTQVGTGFHPNVSLVPALLAVAESLPGASGRTLIAAHVAGLEIACRMTLAATNRAAHPWLTTTLFGVFGAAVAAAKLRGLDAAAMRHVLGIAYSSAGGNRQGLLDGALIQRVQPGLCAQAAVIALALAEEGVSGAHDVLGGFYGLYRSYYGEDFEPSSLTEGLGRAFRMRELGLKRYPCCSYSQEPLEAASELVREHGIEAGEVEAVVVRLPSEHAARLVDHPYRPGRDAQVQAQFSMQYVIAAVLLNGAFSLEDLQERRLRDPQAIALSDRVRVAVDPSRAGEVEVRLKGGAARVRRVEVARGAPSRPLTDDELLEKTRECGRHAARPKTGAESERVFRMARGAAELERAGALAEALA